MDLPAAIQLFVDEYTANEYKVQPATVVAFDSSGTVDIRLSVNDGGAVIYGVPVLYLAGGGNVLSFQLDAGDQGLALFSDVSLDAYKRAQGPTDEPDERRNALSDAMFLPALGFRGMLGADNGIVRKRDLQAAIDELNSGWRTAFNTHTHSGGLIEGNTGPINPPATFDTLGNANASNIRVS